jgi:hypothetical protein
VVKFAATRSRYYQALYRDRDLDEPNIETLKALPPTTKQQLMDHFDEWGTDRSVTRAAVEGLVGDPIASVFWTGLRSGRPRAPPDSLACSCTMQARWRCAKPS